MKWLRLWSACLFLLALLGGQGLSQDIDTVSVPELIQCGRAELASNQWAAAVDDFRSATESAPSNSLAYAGLGRSFLGLGRYQEAVVAYETSVELDPQRTNSWFYLGESYWELGDSEKAAEVYGKYASLKPDNEKAYYRLSYCLYRLKRYDEAESACRQAIAISPTNSVYRAELGYCQGQQMHYPEAVVSLQQALSLNPEDAKVCLWLGIYQYRAKAYRDAVVSLRRCVALQPTNFDGYDWLGSSLYMLHRYNEAAASFRKALQIKPGDFKMNYWLGRSYSALGRYDEAIVYLQRAVQIKSDDFSANDWRGMTLVRLRRFEEAAESFEKAYHIDQEDKSLRQELFVCDLVASRYEDAYRLYPMVFVFGGGSFMLGYLIGFAVLLHFSLKTSDAPAPGFRFSLGWLMLFFEGQVGFIFCLGLLSLFRFSESFLLGITLAGIPIIAAATYLFPRQPWGRPFAAPLRLGTPTTIGLSVVGLIAARLLSSFCMEWISRAMHRPAEVQNILPYIRHALGGDPFTAVLSIAVVGPMAEEIIFRGLLYGAFESRIGVGLTILVSSALFAFAHLQPMYFIPIFCLGMVLGWARYKTSSLGLPILLHVLNNGLALVFLRFFEKGP
jgi:tetratricopeptide (TPR) repeat protein/membrane protease YdiL (CAAX protease family)